MQEIEFKLIIRLHVSNLPRYYNIVHLKIKLHNYEPKIYVT